MNEKNNPEVQEELNTVQIAAQKLVNDLAGDNSVKIVALEVGNNTMLYKDDLFSGNPRNYLGAGKRKNKINLGIMDTVQEQPEKFWAYNNGLTALVNNYEIDNDNITKVHGITIINGTQLTGTIGVVERLKEDFLVPI